LRRATIPVSAEDRPAVRVHPQRQLRRRSMPATGQHHELPVGIKATRFTKRHHGLGMQEPGGTWLRLRPGDQRVAAQHQKDGGNPLESGKGQGLSA
jgi:hypothetical protein